MLIAIYRVFRFAGQNFWRNIWLSVVTVTILTLSLLSVAALSVVSTLSVEALSKLEEKINVSVYLKPQLKPSEIEDVKKQMQEIPGVKEIVLVTADDALQSFTERYRDNPLIAESLIAIGANPLGASLSIKAVSDQGYKTILNELESDKYKSYIQEARFGDYRRIISSINNLTDKLKRIGYGVSLAFGLIALLVVFNTIRLNIYTHREEIGIMRLVGATSWFIRAPLMVESVMYAALATLISALIFYPAIHALQPYVSSFFSGFDFSLVGYYAANWHTFWPSLFVGASLLSIVASAVAMRKYLKT
ncbi:MAG: permease-like cell division protein FtsX [Patescibacteria group bacterium]